MLGMLIHICGIWETLWVVMYIILYIAVYIASSVWVWHTYFGCQSVTWHRHSQNWKGEEDRRGSRARKYKLYSENQTIPVCHFLVGVRQCPFRICGPEGTYNIIGWYSCHTPHHHAYVQHWMDVVTHCWLLKNAWTSSLLCFLSITAWVVHCTVYCSFSKTCNKKQKVSVKVL